MTKRGVAQPVRGETEPPASASTKNGVTTEKVELDSKRYIEFVEVDLWAKFQKRLWTIIAAASTAAALAGIFGLPILVENKVDSVFTQRSKVFDETVAQYLALYRTFFYLNVLYTDYRGRFDSDLLEVTSFLKKNMPDAAADDKAAQQRQFAYRQVAERLQSIADQRDARKSLESRFLNWGQLSIQPVANIDIPIFERIRTEIKTFNGGVASEMSHPFRTGKLGPFMTDVHLRLVILAALEEARQKLTDDILSLGASTELGQATKKLEVESYMQTKIIPTVADAVARFLPSQTFSVPESDKSMFDADKFPELFSLYLQEVGADFAKLDVRATPKIEAIPATESKK